MNIGDKQCARCGDGVMRTGTVTFIHPGGIFYNLKFKFPSGSFQESILTSREENTEKRPKPMEQIIYTPEQDKQILQAKNLKSLAKKLGKSVDALHQHRRRLKMKGVKAK